MSVLRPQGQLPELNTATVLLVGTEDALLQQLADSMLKEDCASMLKVHLAQSLPLPSNVNRPRIDLIVFVVNLHSKYRAVSCHFSLILWPVWSEERGLCLLGCKVCPLVCFLALAWPPQPSERGGVPAPCGRHLLPGEGLLPRHGRWAGQPLQHSPEHRAEAGPDLPEPPALL
ncbi:centromere protein M isoform X2 [Pteropus vampyrus]|uniref:Centromere protein M n=1 Tax=Pteropus vampyrus TaxID=132908 RepID=A0A6P6CXQ4_PTEVA|nr:centromere protein M isoform X2 [Pteropus vampyrus]